MRILFFTALVLFPLLHVAACSQVVMYQKQDNYCPDKLLTDNRDLLTENKKLLEEVIKCQNTATK